MFLTVRRNTRPIDHFFRDFTSPYKPVITLAPVNLSQDENMIYIKMEIAGMKKKDIQIEYKDKLITISGEKLKEEEEYINQEISYGKFSRQIKVGDIDFENAKAEYKDGILSIELPKSEETRNKYLSIK